MTSLAQQKAAVTYGTAAAAAMLAQHIALWDRNIAPERRYLLGTFTLGMAFTAWGLRHDQTQAVAAWWLIVGIAGGTVEAAYAVRNELERRDRAAMAAGRIIGEARYASTEAGE